MMMSSNRRRPGGPSRLRQTSGYRDALLTQYGGGVRSRDMDCGGDGCGDACPSAEEPSSGSNGPEQQQHQAFFPRPRPRLWADNPAVTKKSKKKRKSHDADYDGDDVEAEGGKLRKQRRGHHLSSLASRIHEWDKSDSSEASSSKPKRKSVHFSSTLISDVWTRPRTRPENVRSLFYSKKDEQRFRADYVEWQRWGCVDTDEEESDCDDTNDDPSDSEGEWPMDEKDEVDLQEKDQDCTTPDVSDEDDVEHEEEIADSSSSEEEDDDDDDESPEDDDTDNDEDPEAASPTKDIKFSINDGHDNVPLVEETSGSSSEDEDDDA